MRDVAIIGVGQIPVGEHWESSLRMLAADAISAAQKDAGISQVDAVYVGNAYGSSYSSQQHLGALVADYSGLTGVFLKDFACAFFHRIREGWMVCTCYGDDIECPIL